MTTQKEIEAHWTKEAHDTLTGKRVEAVRYLSAEECQALGWHEAPLVIEFEDGTWLFPSRDDEGNGAGTLFGQTPDRKELTFPVIRPVPRRPAPVFPPRAKYSGPLTSTHKNMLRRIRRGDPLYPGCGKTLGQLRDLGYVEDLQKVPKKGLPQGRHFLWSVRLTQKAA